MSQPTFPSPYDVPMIDELGALLFDDRPGRHRRADHSTSIAGAMSVAYRAGSQKSALLATYGRFTGGLTDEEAAREAGLSMRSCWWKRCSELRQDGMIAPVEGPEGTVKRIGGAGDPQMVCAITGAGRAALEAL